MKNLVTFFTVLFLTYKAVGQPIKQLSPSSIALLELSKKREAAFNETKQVCDSILAKMGNNFSFEGLSDQEKEYFNNYDETVEDYWDILGGGCSWYCGGGPKKVTASSYLVSNNKTSYQAKNAHDLNYKSAWVEGAASYGIGEYLTYTFKAGSPRITEIIIVNGYVKSVNAWTNNSRVKQFKMYINDQPFAILNLEDSRSAQSFEFEPIGIYEDKNAPDWTIKFEILDIYKGDKYDDTVVSEIYFDGIDVH